MLLRLILYLTRMLWWPQLARESPGEWAVMDSPPTDADAIARAVAAVPRGGGPRMDGTATFT